jgi:glycosyltransferase involved in cell wall biosynthesis
MYPDIPIVATFHQPPGTLEIEITTGKTRGKVGRYTHLLSKSRFRKLAAAIVTEENQKKVLSRVMPEEKIHIVPLGVHLSNFHSVYRELKKSGHIPEMNQVITVGNWLRDWKFYTEVLEFCEKSRPLYVFHLVNRKLDPEIELRLSKYRNLVIHRDINDSELKKLLYFSRAHFLPVLGASGNNALIEGLAMGCPAVMTDVMSENFPLRSESVLLYAKGDLQSAINQVDSLVQASDPAHMELKESTFARSIPYDWKEIALKTMKIYQKVTK